jgi:hypothetical protein
VLIVVDRAQRQWDANSYFVVELGGQLQFQWFEEAPDLPLLGSIIVVLRPKESLMKRQRRKSGKWMNKAETSINRVAKFCSLREDTEGK